MYVFISKFIHICDESLCSPQQNLSMCFDKKMDNHERDNNVQCINVLASLMDLQHKAQKSKYFCCIHMIVGILSQDMLFITLYWNVSFQSFANWWPFHWAVIHKLAINFCRKNYSPMRLRAWSRNPLNTFCVGCAFLGSINLTMPLIP